MVTRRALLTGGALAAGVTAAGLLTPSDVRERTLHKAGLANSPDHSVPDAHAASTSGSFASEHRRTKVGWTISVPKETPRAAVICLHGRGNDHRFAFDQIKLPDVAASLKFPLVVAAVDGGEASYWHPRADGTDALAMVMDEFLPLVKKKVGDLPLAVMGWSMGGYGALLTAERAPTTFHAVAAASPALWRTAGDTAPGAFDDPEDFKANDVFAGVRALDTVTTALACGSGDPFYVQSQRFAGLLRGTHRADFGKGFHDAAYWRSVAPAQLRAMAPALGLTPMTNP